jgi:hypothetical protein
MHNILRENMSDMSFKIAGWVVIEVRDGFLYLQELPEDFAARMRASAGPQVSADTSTDIFIEHYEQLFRVINDLHLDYLDRVRETLDADDDLEVKTSRLEAIYATYKAFFAELQEALTTGPLKAMFRTSVAAPAIRH